MQAKDNWKDYSKDVDKLAHKTIRSWMIGTEVDDVKQELWTEFFRLCKETPLIVREDMLFRLEKFASLYKREEREHKYGRGKDDPDERESLKYQKYWSHIGNMWETYLKKLSQRDSVILRYVAQGNDYKTTAKCMGLGLRTIERVAPALIANFKKEVENSVQARIPGRNSIADEGV